jgi:uncharacterized protein YbaR (Trm112 family)
MEIKREDISEETRYVWECPKCQHFNESCDDPNYEESMWCEDCNESFDIID